MPSNNYCNSCKLYNCHKHYVTAKLVGLLDHFTPPLESDIDLMRTFVPPEKHTQLHPNHILPSRGGGSFDRHDQNMDSVKFIPSSRQFDDIEARKNANSKNTAIVPYKDQLSQDRASATSNNSSNVVKLVGGRYKTHEVHHFTKLNNISFVSISAPGDLYSETQIILWIENNNYSKISSDRFRAVITVLFDKEAELWNVSAKLVKRPAYYKDEEDQICNRLCFTSDLRTEIKKLLLFLGISPRQVYRMFRKILTENMIIAKADGFTTVTNAYHADYMKSLDKSTSSSTSSASSAGWDYRHKDPYARGHVGGPTGHTAKNQNFRHNSQSYNEAMQGFANSEGMEEMCGYFCGE